MKPKLPHTELKNYMVIACITNCLFFFAIKSKKYEPGDIARSLMNTPRQCFGHHVACRNYCQAVKLSNPAEHRFKNFPRGKPLQARSLQQFLGELFSPYVDIIPFCTLYNIYRSDCMHLDIFRFVGDVGSRGHDKD